MSEDSVDFENPIAQTAKVYLDSMGIETLTKFKDTFVHIRRTSHEAGTPDLVADRVSQGLVKLLSSGGAKYLTELEVISVAYVLLSTQFNHVVNQLQQATAPTE